MAGCVVCGEHVSTGEALLILKGQLTGGSEFEAEETAGVAHARHLEKHWDVIDAAKFPLTFAL